ncbi:hypothetical protein E2542_SST14330 [Spatholobus suberectus]|nr:hypothetical protein E2542_SST14330 [Spatholobus suberectus]
MDHKLRTTEQNNNKKKPSSVLVTNHRERCELVFIHTSALQTAANNREAPDKSPRSPGLVFKNANSFVSLILAATFPPWTRVLQYLHNTNHHQPPRRCRVINRSANHHRAATPSLTFSMCDLLTIVGSSSSERGRRSTLRRAARDSSVPFRKFLREGMKI